jgi:hypothetical protein
MKKSFGQKWSNAWWFVSWINRGVGKIELQGRLYCDYVCGASRLIMGQHMALFNLIETFLTFDFWFQILTYPNI